MGLDRKYLVWALAYVVLGMGLGLGIYMAASKNHTQHITHAHILLVGFVVLFIYAVIHKLWLGEAVSRLAAVQFVLHQVGALLMFSGLFLLYGGFVPEAQIELILASSTFIVFTAALLMIAMVRKTVFGGNQLSK